MICPIHERIVEFVDNIAGDEPSRSLMLASLLWKVAERVPAVMADVIDDGALELAAIELEVERGLA